MNSDYYVLCNHTYGSSLISIAYILTMYTASCIKRNDVLYVYTEYDICRTDTKTIQENGTCPHCYVYNYINVCACFLSLYMTFSLHFEHFN